MKLALILTVWKRHDLERIVIEQFKKQAKKYGFTIVVAGSEGEVSQSLAKGCEYIEIENYPVSRKHNACVQRCKELNVDGVMLFGSDDFITDEYFDFIYQNLESKELIGLKDLYFYSTYQKRFAYFDGWAKNRKTIGAGRYFSKHILEAMDWKLWDDDKNNALDSNCSTRLAEMGIDEIAYLMSEIGCSLIDVKHTHSITSDKILSISTDVNVKNMAKRVKEVVKEVEKLEIPVASRPINDHVEEYQEVGTVLIVSTGKYKEMPKGEEYEVSKDVSKELIRKGYATLK